ncbi:UNVERIFIED_CONTAM: hypothetical protein Slati_4330800 [Sesamum latifolium]|uniref:Uncharacterized protein n=1 Tax=Sesamum latifolium TaxID=2727402 RepID=A0AAW2SPI6_9LAMI
MEACELLEQLRQQMLAAEAHTMRSDEVIKKLKRKELEADRTVQLRREVLAGEEHKKMSDRMLDKMRAKESEDVQRMQELRTQNLEASRTVEELRQQVLAAEENKKMCDQAIEEIRARQSEDIRTVEELKRQNLETSHTMEELRKHILDTEERIKISDKTIEEMKARQSEDYQTVEELKRQKLEAYNAAEIHKRRFENLAPMAEGLASLLKVKVDDLVNLVAVEDKSLAAEGNEVLTFRVSMDGKRSLRNDSADGAGNADVLVIVKSLGMRSTCNSSKSGYSCVPERGDRNLPESSWAKHGDIVVYNPHQTSYPVQSNYATPQAARNYGGQENGVENYWIPKRKRTEFEIDWEKGDVNIVGESSNSQILKYDDFNDSTPTHNLDNRVLQTTWMFASDMLKAFMEDDELCMNAVCALYRQQVAASKSPGGFAGLFQHFEAMSGRALAEYLIGGDPELKLRKSVAEVKRTIHLCYPSLPEACNRLLRASVCIVLQRRRSLLQIRITYAQTTLHVTLCPCSTSVPRCIMCTSTSSVVYLLF